MKLRKASYQFQVNIVCKNVNPRPGRAFSITRPGRGVVVSVTPPAGVSKLSVVALRETDQSIALDEYSRLVVYFVLP